MNIKFSYYTNKGDIRANNEDSLLIDNIIKNNLSLNEYESLIIEDKNSSIAVVADGMGGYEKGELASKIALESLVNVNSKESIKEFLLKAKLQLNDLVKENPTLLGIGTTLAGIYIDENSIEVFNMGDCRVYKYSRGFLEKVSNDHSKVQVLFDIGEISEDDMRTHPNKNLVTSSLSGDKSLSLDEVYLKTLKRKDNQIFFLCSDGLWEIFSIEELEACFDKDNITEIAKDIIEKSTEKEKSDNISFIIVEVE